MRRKKVLWVNLIGNDFETVIPKGTDGRDVEIAIAQLLLSIVDLEKSRGNKDFKLSTLIRGIELLCRQLDEHQNK